MYLMYHVHIYLFQENKIIVVFNCVHCYFVYAIKTRHVSQIVMYVWIEHKSGIEEEA